jgi:aquaporin Z
MLPTIRSHRAEYASEMGSLALFMMSAAGFATLLQHPASPWSLGANPTALERAPMGIAMGLTAIAMIYSPWGRRSGAHMNPAVTLAFWRLGKISTVDAAFYILAQFAGGIGGIALATQLLAQLPADPSVNYVATVPGPAGQAIALAAETFISFGMMLVVLLVSNHARFNRLTGLSAGFLVFAYITIEAPLSGMSMNPARSLGSALLAGSLESIWIYFVAPLVGMVLAAEAFVRRYGAARVLCAKLHHPSDGHCIFRCRFAAPATRAPISILPANEVSA